MESFFVFYLTFFLTPNSWVLFLFCLRSVGIWQSGEYNWQLEQGVSAFNYDVTELYLGDESKF